MTIETVGYDICASLAAGMAPRIPTANTDGVGRLSVQLCESPGRAASAPMPAQTASQWMGSLAGEPDVLSSRSLMVIRAKSWRAISSIQPQSWGRYTSRTHQLIDKDGIRVHPDERNSQIRTQPPSALRASEGNLAVLSQQAHL